MINIKLVPIEVLDILHKLQTGGFKSFIVGGSVRDLLLGREPKDFDICTAATPQQVKNIFGKVIDTGLKFGTVTVLAGNISVEITTFRQTAITNNGHRFSVTGFGESEAEDVNARDFTVNGLLFDGKKIVDYVNGVSDLKDKIIRAIGQPKQRFLEDALRMMRAIRLGCQLGFNIEQSTFSAIISNSDLIVNVSRERIRDEFVRTLMSQEPARGIGQMRETGLLQYIMPELQACYEFRQYNPHHDKDVFKHTMAVLENTGENLVVRLAALLHDIGKPKTFSMDEKGIGHFYAHNLEGFKLSKKILSGMKFDNKTIESVSLLVKEHMCRHKGLRKTGIKKLINRVGPDRIGLLIDLQVADEAGSAPPHDFSHLNRLKQEVHNIICTGEPLSVKDLAISGTDLIEMGYKPGPDLGHVLKALLTRVIANPEINNKETLVNIVTKEFLKGTRYRQINPNLPDLPS